MKFLKEAMKATILEAIEAGATQEQVTALMSTSQFQARVIKYNAMFENLAAGKDALEGITF